VGIIHNELLEAGVQSATHVDASDPFLHAASDEARTRGHAERVRFLRGDFVALAPDIPPADIVTLDRAKTRTGVSRFVRAALAFSIALGCSSEPWPRPAGIPQEQFVREFQEWREYRRSRLVLPAAGPVTWVGLWDLRAGALALGSDSSLPIVLPSSQSPRRVGTLRRTGPDVRFEPAASAKIRLADGTPVTKPLTLASDRTDTPTDLALGSLRLRVHGEPGTDRLWLRAWDEEHPARQTFKLPESYPPDTVWLVSARFRAFSEPREFQVPDITLGTQAYRSPGELVFRLGGTEHRLAAFADTSSTAFFVMIWDSTATTTTYQAGRYLRAPFPDVNGWTVIDFNRAYNPPCVFTPYSTCAFAPRENRLALWVSAGEKRVR
jgi:hypothetical protein